MGDVDIVLVHGRPNMGFSSPRVVTAGEDLVNGYGDKKHYCCIVAVYGNEL